jgi:hypothetical protein
MSRISRARPSPAMVVACVALSFAVAGSAIAGTEAVTSAITKKKVKKIAKRQANKRLKANVAGSHVNLADQATNATNAANATTLGGAAGDVYLDRGATATRTGGTDVPVQAAEILEPVSITVPGGVHFVRSTGTATFSDTDASFESYIFWVEQDQTCQLSGFGFDRRMFGETIPPNTASQTLLWSVSPGTHTYRMCARAGGAGVVALNQSLVVDTVARGATGTPATAHKSGERAADADGDPMTPQ